MSDGAPLAEDRAGRDAGNRRPTLADVGRCYRILLGREVESLAAASEQIVHAPDVMLLAERIWGAQEAQRHRIEEACSRIPALHAAAAPVEEAGAEILERLYAEHEGLWLERSFGRYRDWLRQDEPRYAERSARWNLERTLERGAAEARELQALCARHGHAFREGDMVAVFGAEAFRLAGEIAPRVARYWSVEAAAQDVTLAQQAIAAHGLEGRVVPATIGAFRRSPATMDFLYSVSALQYAPPPMMIDLLGGLLSRLNPGGWAVFQLPSHLHDHRFALGAYLAGEGREPAGEIHAVPQARILSLLRERGFALLEVIPDSRVGRLGMSYTYVARRDGCAAA